MTNLADDDMDAVYTFRGIFESDIPALRSLNKKLTFLGLFFGNFVSYENIPAIKVKLIAERFRV